jgi:hypothetical protein
MKFLALNPQLIGLSPRWLVGWATGGGGIGITSMALTSSSKKTKQMAASILFVAWSDRPDPVPPHGEEAETKVDILRPSSAPLSKGALLIASEALVRLRPDRSLDDERRSSGDDLVEEMCLRTSWVFSPARWSWRDSFGDPTTEGDFVTGSACSMCGGGGMGPFWWLCWVWELWVCSTGMWMLETQLRRRFSLSLIVFESL